MSARKIVKKEKKQKKEKEKEKGKVKKGRPPKREVIVEERPTKKVDIDTTMYRNLFKFLEEKVSVECFIDLHEHCFGKSHCECECHTKR